MSRYIDADKLWNDRPSPSRGQSQDYDKGFWDCIFRFSELIRKHINNSTADVVDVVRCRDCLFARVEDGKIKCYNTYGLLVTKETEYCSRGRRRSNDGT
jgi:hypothetical protein